MSSDTQSNPNPDIQLSVAQGIGTLTLNRPQVLNSLSLEAIKALLAQLRAVGADPTIRALLITGAGRGFCAGWQLDPEGVPGLSDESLGVRQSHLMAEYFNPVIQAMHDLPIPIVAAVNGVSAGAGVSIALAADVVIAARSSAFLMTFAPRLGLLPDLGATWKLPRLLGWARAQAVTMLGGRIEAAQAEQWGMIWRCVADEDLQRVALESAAQLAQSPPGICREVRHAFEAAQLKDLAQQMDFERLRQRALLDSASFAEGLLAFEQKRAPDFYGAAR